MQFVTPGDRLVLVYQKAPLPRSSHVFKKVLQLEVTLLPVYSGCVKFPFWLSLAVGDAGKVQ